jgi:hypothetical protein
VVVWRADTPHHTTKEKGYMVVERFGYGMNKKATNAFFEEREESVFVFELFKGLANECPRGTL